MLKQAFIRGINSFMYSVGITVLIQFVIIMINDDFCPFLPEFSSHFENGYQALLMQNILIGLASASFGAGSVIMELERLGIIAQSILYFVVTTMAWYPVGCVCFGLNKYPQTMITMGLSYLVSYTICWAVQYRLCKRDVQRINTKLKELRKEEEVNE